MNLYTITSTPAGFAVVGNKSGRTYGTHASEAEARREVSEREARAKVRAKIRRAVAEAIEDGAEDVGFCLACGAYHEGVEPDARGYECEECGAEKVAGLEVLAIMLG